MPQVDWLMMILASGEGRLGTALDPIRIQKALFYISRDPSVPAAEKYSFEPYNYGPYSRAIYADLDALVEEGLLQTTPAPSGRWRLFSLTSTGFARFDEIRSEAPPAWLALAGSVRTLVTSLSFTELLRRVYRDFPEFAVNSIANV